MNFRLNFDGFEKNMKRSWQGLQIDGDFCDVTLACEDKQIRSHKAILSSCSPMLRNIFKTDNNIHPLIYLRKVKHKDLQNLLTFMYQGEVNVAEVDLQGILDIADDLNIKGLQKISTLEEGTSSKIAHQNNVLSPKRRTVKNEPRQDIVNADYVSSSNDFEEASNSRIHNDIIGLLAPKENYSKIDTINQNVDVNRDSLISKNEMKFDCENCPRLFSSRGGLRLHTQSVHMGVEYSCDKCNYKTTQKGNLKRHVVTHHGGKLIPCDQCDYKARKMSILKSHMVSTHEGKCHVCDQCDYKATTKTLLDSHVRKCHRGLSI